MNETKAFHNGPSISVGYAEAPQVKSTLFNDYLNQFENVIDSIEKNWIPFIPKKCGTRISPATVLHPKNKTPTPPSGAPKLWPPFTCMIPCCISSICSGLGTVIKKPIIIPYAEIQIPHNNDSLRYELIFFRRNM